VCVVSQAEWPELRNLALQTASSLRGAGWPTQCIVSDVHGWVVDEHIAWFDTSDYSGCNNDSLLLRERTGFETYLLAANGRIYYEDREERLFNYRDRPAGRTLGNQSIAECGPGDVWRLDVGGTRCDMVTTYANGVKTSGYTAHRIEAEQKIYSTWGDGLRRALEGLPRRQYSKSMRENYLAWVGSHATRTSQPQSSRVDGRVYLIVGAVVAMILLGLCCGLCTSHPR
jgi:hypothetical protein